MDCSTPGFTVLHYLWKFAQMHVHCRWYYLTISSSATHFSFCPQSSGSDGNKICLQCRRWVRFLSPEDPLEKWMATHSGILAWKIPWTEEPGGLQSMGSPRIGHDWVTNTFPAPGSFPMSLLFALGGQNIDTSTSASVLPVLIFFMMDRFDLLAVHGPLKSLLQHHSSKASILRHSAFFIVHLSYPYLTTRKTIALTTCTLLAKWYLCFLICCLHLLQLSIQGASIFSFHFMSP